MDSSQLNDVLRRAVLRTKPSLEYKLPLHTHTYIYLCHFDVTTSMLTDGLTDRSIDCLKDSLIDRAIG